MKITIKYRINGYYKHTYKQKTINIDPVVNNNGIINQTETMEKAKKALNVHYDEIIYYQWHN